MVSHARVFSKICAKHPQLKGERYAKNRACPACQSEYNRSHQTGRKAKAMIAYGGVKCAICGEDDIDKLTIDHTEQNGALHRKAIKATSGNSTYTWLKQNGYPPGFRVLCFNCNMKEFLDHKRAKLKQFL